MTSRQGGMTGANLDESLRRPVTICSDEAVVEALVKQGARQERGR